MIRTFGLFAFSTLISAFFVVPSASKAGVPSKADCKAAAEDLKAMQKAQQSISESLISNHDVFANLLEEYSTTLNTSAMVMKPVTPEAVNKMNESAKAFRTRGQNAEKLNKKLTLASNDVIERAITCLKK